MIKIDKNSFTEVVHATLREAAEPMHFLSNEIVLEQGRICKHLYLIEQGMLRNFYFDSKGNDITHWFAREEMIVTAPPSFFKQEASFFGIEAVEDTKVLAVSFDKLEKALKDSIELERFLRITVTEVMITLGQKIIDLQTQSAEYRYDQLLMTHPDIFQRAKLGHIAGYLGIKQQSLSRIRAAKMRK